ncbi:RHS repeat-associated core domain-containing protein, partial [Cronobacter sakazakii]|uniref:RHS repeat-associated core domain-containing protein n=3 Tax=Cronobacter sakazakii TaxID=28141 RepID=UPI001F27792C
QRRDKSGVIQHFAYDDEQRVKEIRFEGNTEFRRVEYRYDPLGRRTHKVLWRYGEKDPETIRFDWQGLQLAGEKSDREPDHYVQYVYTEGSYEPLARIDSVFDDCEIYWYHTELNGLPERVTDADGQTVWRGQFSTWGETERELSVPQWQVPQNLRFQGQYLDRESGLHYNLFRYYDPVAGRYTQMDPIGLAGGMNTYSYVGDPLVWVDPLGLAGCSTTLGKNMMQKMGLSRSTTWKGYQAHHIIPKQLSNHPALKKIRYYIDDADNGIFLRKTDEMSSAMARHQGNHDGYTKAVENALNKIDINASKDVIASQVRDIQSIARKGMEKGYPIRPLDMDSAGGALGNNKVNDLWSRIFNKGGW